MKNTVKLTFRVKEEIRVSYFDEYYKLAIFYQNRSITARLVPLQVIFIIIQTY